MGPLLYTLCPGFVLVLPELPERETPKAMREWQQAAGDWIARMRGIGVELPVTKAPRA